MEATVMAESATARVAAGSSSDHSWTGLVAQVAQLILLYCDDHTLCSLRCADKWWQQTVDDEWHWEQAVKNRFGRDCQLVPALHSPANPSQLRVAGTHWSFYPGLLCASVYTLVADQDIVELAHLAYEKRADAFTTSGQIIHVFSLPHQWLPAATSAEGTYVRTEIAVGQAPVTGGSVPGSVGAALGRLGRLLQRAAHTATQAVLGAAPAGPAPAPLAHPPPPTWGPWRSTYHWLARRCNSLTDPSCSSVAWLGEPNQYLMAVTAPNSVSSQVLQLNSVCWLQVQSSFRGVLPGHYRLVWRVTCAGIHQADFQSFMDAFVTAVRDTEGRPSHTVQAPPATEAVLEEQYPALRLEHNPDSHSHRGTQGGTEVQAPHSPAMGMTGALPDDGCVCRSKLTDLWTWLHTGGLQWVQLEVGRFRVPEGQVWDVLARWHNTRDGWWKHGLRWDCVALLPLPDATDLTTSTAGQAHGRSRLPAGEFSWQLNRA